jgi:hypothetical protein
MPTCMVDFFRQRLFFYFSFWPRTGSKGRERSRGRRAVASAVVALVKGNKALRLGVALSRWSIFPASFYFSLGHWRHRRSRGQVSRKACKREAFPLPPEKRRRRKWSPKRARGRPCFLNVITFFDLGALARSCLVSSLSLPPFWRDRKRRAREAGEGGNAVSSEKRSAWQPHAVSNGIE